MSGESDAEKRDDEERSRKFRRPRFHPASEDSTDANEAGQDGGGDDGGLSPVTRASSAEGLPLAMQPLKELADAFRQNSETLRSLAEGQARMARRMDRSDRSEAVINSTKALNETFRGVQRTQERLVSRLEGEKKRPWIFLIAVLVTTGLVLGGILWFLLSWVDRRDEQTAGSGALALRDTMKAEQAENADLHADVARMTGEIATGATRHRSLEITITGLEARVQELTEENGNLRIDREETSRLNRETAALSAEVARLEQEVGRLRDELADARVALAERDTRIAGLMKKPQPVSPGNGGSQGATAPRAGPPPEPEVENGAPTGNVSAGPPAEAVTDTAAMDRLKRLLNRLLHASRAGIGYRFEQIGAARGKVLYNVVVLNVDEQGREMKRIESRELRILLREKDKEAELRFGQGHLVYYGVRAPFFGGAYEVTLYDIDPAAWRTSGLTVIEVSR